ncbi:C-C chemokine receptor type 2-like [Misgurnus anguillicaudatus]|uniref:C-C chemokine receptor type 2-like n=1 Tax=Misgurnus anguillicaudatus TaxID=75329 RepID=UPI003CCFC953
MTENSNNTSSVYDYSDSDDTNTEENSVQPFQVFVATLYSIVFIIGIIGNILVLSIVFKYFRWRIFKFFRTEKCIFHIALADLLFLISLPFWAYDAMAEWIFGGFMCRTVTALYMLGLYGSVFFMVLIIVNEYLHFFLPFYGNTITLKMSCFVWIFSLLACLPNVIFTRDIQGTHRTVCVHDFPNPAWRSFTFLNMNLLSFIIPLIIIVFCYLRFCVSLERVTFRFRTKLNTMLAVVVVHFLLWAPYNIALFIIILQTNGYLQTFEWSGMNLAMQWVEIVAYIQCCLKPIIYILFEQKFRTFRGISYSSALTSRFPLPALEESWV